MRQHYQDNKEYYRAKHKKHRTVIREVARQAKERPCIDCGVQYPYYVMQFDHRDPLKKLYAIGQMAQFGSIAKLKQEIEKCDVVCANCHAVRTHNRRVAKPADAQR